MNTLAVNAAFHDSPACLVREGEMLAGAEEARFTRSKHGKRPLPCTTWGLPHHAIDHCLAETGVDHVAYSFDPRPLLKNHSSFELP